jgi:AcrR family transcriptional regulator
LVSHGEINYLMMRQSASDGSDSDGRVGVVPGGLREVHTADTRRRILRAVNELLVDEHPATLSIRSVAERAGISSATIYRYFPTKEDLLDAAARTVEEQTRAWMGDEPIVPGRSLGPFIDRMWSELARDLPALRSAHASPIGRDLRARRSERRLRDASTGLALAGVDLDTESGQQALRMTLVLTSSSVLIEQIDRLHLPVDKASADVVWAIETLVGAVAAEGAEAAERTDGPPADRRATPATTATMATPATPATPTTAATTTATTATDEEVGHGPG